jgi:hypothetical protein
MEIPFTNLYPANGVGHHGRGGDEDDGVVHGLPPDRARCRRLGPTPHRFTRARRPPCPPFAESLLRPRAYRRCQRAPLPNFPSPLRLRTCGIRPEIAGEARGCSPGRHHAGCRGLGRGHWRNGGARRAAGEARWCSLVKRARTSVSRWRPSGHGWRLGEASGGAPLRPRPCPARRRALCWWCSPAVVRSGESPPRSPRFYGRW